MHGDELSDVTRAGERWLRENAVAELRVEKTALGAVWLIVSRDQQIDQAIADAVPTERRSGAAPSCQFVRALLVDEVVVRIADADAVHIGGAGIDEKADGRCPCQDGGGVESSGQYGCLCGCHVGGICRKSITRNCRGEVPQAAFLFRLLAVPDLGPVFMRSTSWALSLWLRDLARSGAARSEALEARIRLRRTGIRTRSGVEVALTQPVGQRLSWEDPTAPYRVAA
jgi:hypothetical protein